MTQEEQEYFDVPNNWLNFVLKNYTANIVRHKDSCMYGIQFLTQHEPMKHSRYIKIDGKIMEIGIVGDIAGEITDENLLSLFNNAKEIE